MNVKGSQDIPLPGEIHVADLRPITGQECVGNPIDDKLANAARRPGAKHTSVGPGCVRVRTPDDREWHQAHRRPNRPNPNRFNKPGIRPICKM